VFDADNYLNRTLEIKCKWAGTQDQLDEIIWKYRLESGEEINAIFLGENNNENIFKFTFENDNDSHNMASLEVWIKNSTFLTEYTISTNDCSQTSVLRKQALIGEKRK
jgi:hypothetical protein